MIAEGKFGTIIEVSDSAAPSSSSSSSSSSTSAAATTSEGVWNYVKIAYDDGTSNRDDKAGYLRLHITPVYLTGTVDG